MSYSLLVITLIVAVADWFAVLVKKQSLEFVLKPATMLLLIAWYIQNGGLQGWLIWFCLGAVFSLIGDILLMLPKEQFVAGLLAFLLAQLAYIIGFNPSLPSLHPLIVALAVGLAIFITWFFRILARSLDQRGLPRLKLPVLVYSIVISLMLLSAAACLTRPEWQPLPAAVVTLGALSFMFSDCVLAWNKFVAPLSWGRFVNMATYHLGQIGILLGVLLGR